MTSKILIVGAGFSGATIARVLAEAGLSVTIIDKRDAVAGNAFDYVNSFGVRVHKYGPHLFHTNDTKVVDFLSRFTDWIPYKHRVKALLLNSQLVTLPVNLDTLNIVGKDKIIDTFYRPYTKKMWGLEIEDLAPEILERVPVRNDNNEYYFPDDAFQALPVNGYHSLVLNILSHPNINLMLSTSFDRSFEDNFDHIFNSMSIDEYFEYKFGVLPYRSIKFHNYDIPLPGLFPVATVNFTHSGKFTRVTEWKNLPNHGDNPYWSSISVEEPCDFIDNSFERYYPVKDGSGINRSLYNKYSRMVPPKVTFIGRCGLYAYLDMHQAVSSSMSIAKAYLARLS